MGLQYRHWRTRSALSLSIVFHAVLEKFPGEKAYFEDLAECRRKEYLKGPRGEDHIESPRQSSVVPSPRRVSREPSPRKASREAPLRPVSKGSRHVSKESMTD